MISMASMCRKRNSAEGRGAVQRSSERGNKSKRKGAIVGFCCWRRVIKHGFAILHAYKMMLKSLKIGRITNHRTCAKK